MRLSANVVEGNHGLGPLVGLALTGIDGDIHLVVRIGSDAFGRRAGKAVELVFAGHLDGDLADAVALITG